MPDAVTATPDRPLARPSGAFHVVSRGRTMRHWDPMLFFGFSRYLLAARGKSGMT